MAGLISYLSEGVVSAKGILPYSLEKISTGRGARARLQKLHDAVSALAPEYRGLERVFDTHLVSHVFRDPRVRQNAVDYLGPYWFDPKSPQAHFPGHDVAPIYAAGVLKALELSLGGARIIPIRAWWIVDAPDVRMLTFADVDNGVTKGGNVTLLIMTPRPKAGTPISRTPILGDTAQAFVSRSHRRAVTTRSQRDLAQED